jgi:hypothetical protein
VKPQTADQERGYSLGLTGGERHHAQLGSLASRQDSSIRNI